MIKRSIYQLLLRLHPAAFQERFAEEMLWIFDEMLDDIGPTRLCTDAAFSLIKQHLSNDPVPRSKSGLFQGSPEETLSGVRLFQAGVVASITLSGFLGLLRQPVPLRQPARTFAVRTYQPDVCSEWTLDSRPPEHQHVIRRAPSNRAGASRF